MRTTFWNKDPGAGVGNQVFERFEQRIHDEIHAEVLGQGKRRLA